MSGFLTISALGGFHLAITLLALYFGYRALRQADREGRADLKTIWRMAALRICAVVSGLSALLLTFIFLLLATDFFRPRVLSGFGEEALVFMAIVTWIVWLPSTIALDNLAQHWRRKTKRNSSY